MTTSLQVHPTLSVHLTQWYYSTQFSSWTCYYFSSLFSQLVDSSTYILTTMTLSTVPNATTAILLFFLFQFSWWLATWIIHHVPLILLNKSALQISIISLIVLPCSKPYYYCHIRLSYAKPWLLIFLLSSSISYQSSSPDKSSFIMFFLHCHLVQSNKISP